MESKNFAAHFPRSATVRTPHDSRNPVAIDSRAARIAGNSPPRIESSTDSTITENTTGFELEDGFIGSDFCQSLARWMVKVSVQRGFGGRLRPTALPPGEFSPAAFHATNNSEPAQGRLDRVEVRHLARDVEHLGVLDHTGLIDDEGGALRHAAHDEILGR